jgi:vacuolar-type H+-ATPase subunit F/Vma7
VGAIVAVGELVRVQGFGLAGVRTVPAEDAAAVRSAWATLPPEVSAVILTRAAAEALGADTVTVDGDRLVVVLP